MAGNERRVATNKGAVVRADPPTSLEKGYKVILALKPGAAPLRVYGGQIKAIDGFGLRVTLGDWLIGRFCGNDLWVAWGNVDSILVYTPDDDLSDYVHHLACWQHELAEYASPEEKVAAHGDLKQFLEGLAEDQRTGPDTDPRPLSDPQRLRGVSPIELSVYFIQAGAEGAIKIGVARNVESRRLALQSASSERLRLLAVQSGDRSAESALHRRFAADRLQGEWFRPSEELLNYIESLGGVTAVRQLPDEEAKIPKGVTVLCGRRGFLVACSGCPERAASDAPSWAKAEWDFDMRGWSVTPEEDGNRWLCPACTCAHSVPRYLSDEDVSLPQEDGHCRGCGATSDQPGTRWEGRTDVLEAAGWDLRRADPELVNLCDECRNRYQ